MGNTEENPTVTVLLPVYNGSRYLREAVKSVLEQSWQDFELLIIDDGSTDDSAAIIKSFSDPRIRLIQNEYNVGVARTLNRGLELARGEYVARMDADDISLPSRLEKQLVFLSEHAEIDVVATKVELIDAAGRNAGVWREDATMLAPEDIACCLPRANCIAHPAVMMRTEVARQYGYWDQKSPAQDYNLWLRMAADNVGIAKLDDSLLKHRRHAQSVTSRSNLIAFGVKDIQVKSGFILQRLKRNKYLNRFDLRVLGFLLLELGVVARVWLVKQFRSLVRSLLLAVGRICSRLAAAKSESPLVFFFPFYHTGGAEQVHADIVSAVADQNPLVVFTRRSENHQYRELFSKQAQVLDASFLLENCIARIICLGYFSALINGKGKVRVLGANTTFFYELLPYLGDHVECIDLLHAFGGGLEEVSLPCVERLNRRVVINCNTFDDLKEQYAANTLDEALLKRITLIENAVVVPGDLEKEKGGGPLRVLYVGRGSAEKRVHLVGEIAKLCKDHELSIEFTLVGDVLAALSPHCRDSCTIVGPVVQTPELEEYYRRHDLLLVTSRKEGFPLVIMEAMAHGVVPACTAVGGIPAHVIDGVTGFLVAGDEAEEKITQAFVDLLSRLSEDRSMLEKMSEQAYCHAREHFDLHRFKQSYRQLLDGNLPRGAA